MLFRVLPSIWRNQHFALLPENDDVEESNGKHEVESMTPELKSPLRRIDQRTWQRSGLEICLTLCALSLTLSVYLLTSVLRTRAELRPTGREFGDCAEQGSIEQARAAGCVFDPVGSIWTKPECYDAELAAEFVGKINYKFYSNETQTPEHEMPLEEWLAGDWPFILPGKRTTICIAITYGRSCTERI